MIKDLRIKSILVLCFLLLVSVSARPQSVIDNRTEYEKKFIGLKFSNRDKLPDNLKSSSGYMLDTVNNTEFALKEVLTRNRVMIWFERFLFRDSTGNAHFEVIDVLLLPQLKKNQIIIFGTCLYVGDSGYDPEIVAIGDDSGKPEVDHIRRAWRANRLTGKFELESVEYLRAINESRIPD